MSNYHPLEVVGRDLNARAGDEPTITDFPSSFNNCAWDPPFDFQDVISISCILVYYNIIEHGICYKRAVFAIKL